MNEQEEKNYEYLSNQVKFSGFGEGLAESLKEQMQIDQATFILKYEPEFGNGDVKASLHFRRSEETGMVFFNKYDLEVKQSADTMKQTFYMGKENNLTLKEAFNLMEGRSVYKEREKLQEVGEGENKRYELSGEKYFAWLRLDFTDVDKDGNFKIKPQHENYGFDLSETISKLPIKELDDSEKKSQMLRSLERGNLHTVTYVKDGEERKGTVLAVPQFKMAKLFDEKGNEISKSLQKKQDQAQSTSKSQKENLDNSEKQKTEKTSKRKVGTKM